MSTRAVDRRRAELVARREPFVMATVVRARRPTSAQPGDTALVLPDGRVEGFVGGACAEASVRAFGLQALASGESLLLRISPDEPEAADPPAVDEGAIDVANPCLSGGSLEIFLEPLRPAPRVLVLGEAPIGRSLVALAAGADYDIEAVAPGGGGDDAMAGATAVVVASHGRDEEPVLRAALRAGVPYVALVASRRRGAAVLAGLDVTPEQRARVRTPAGLDIGARTPGEVAVSILAEIVATVRARPRGGDRDTGPGPTPAPDPGSGPATAVDPVCGMTVAAVDTTLHSDAGGERRWFCGVGCRDAYDADPARYADAG